MTLTQRQRTAFPKRYIRKDARTRIYRVLFGPAPIGRFMDRLEYPDPKGRPEDNKNRQLPQHWAFENAYSVWEANKAAADFSGPQFAALEERLEQLRRYKPRQAA